MFNCDFQQTALRMIQNACRKRKSKQDVRK